jgi:spoIIIJ-associated protein
VAMTLEEFLTLIIKSVRLNLSIQIVDETEEATEVNLQGSDDSILLARNAELLRALEYLCNRVFEKTARKITIDCNGYRAIRAEELRLIALKAAESAKRIGKPFKLSPMSPEERRIVHLAVADDAQIRTESEGFGENRKVVFYPRGDANTE